MSTTRVPYSVFIDTVTPLPTGSGSLLLINDLKKLSDALVIVSGNLSSKITYLSEDMATKLGGDLDARSCTIFGGTLYCQHLYTNNVLYAPIATTTTFGTTPRITTKYLSTLYIGNISDSTFFQIKELSNEVSLITTANTFSFLTSGGGGLSIVNTGNYNARIGLNNTTPSAYLHLPTGRATANYAPLKIDNTLSPLKVPENGVLEFISGVFSFTTSGVRKSFIFS